MYVVTPHLHSAPPDASIRQDWPRHRKECVPATSQSQPQNYNMNMIATPPPAEPQYITVSAILFAPEEGTVPPNRRLC